MRALAVPLLALMLVVGCREAPPPTTTGPVPPSPEVLQQAERDCQRTGGRMVNAGILNAKVCLRDMPDAGRQCRKAGDCQGDCLARSGTCAPVKPLFGCHEILMQNGQRATLCRD